MSFASYVDAVKRHYKYTPDEIKAIVITILAFTFIMAFDDKRATFSIGYWGLNFAGWLAIITVSVLVHHTGHRLAGIKAGFRVEYKLWWHGIVVGLIMAVITGGKLPLLIPGGIFIHHMAVHRLGFFRYGPNTLALSLIAMMGPLFNIFFATIVKTIEIWFKFIPISHSLVEKIFLFNLLYAAFTLLPIPPLDGSRLFFHSRLVYAFVFGTVASYALLAYVFGIYSYIIALIMGVIIYLVYYIVFERTAWKF